MGALPKRKLSKGRGRRRRAHLALKTASLVVCPQCKNMRLPHHVCPTCGSYRGAEMIQIESEPAK